MGNRKRPAVPTHSLAVNARLAPLPLDPATVAAVGYVRAAFDAVRAHPAVIESRATARTLGLSFMVQTSNAAGDFARRTAIAAGMNDAPAQPPPF